jgi:antitoxin (DNA-binding transcriptional repressor) of toxin-antitoxin stability system
MRRVVPSAVALQSTAPLTRLGRSRYTAATVLTDRGRPIARLVPIRPDAWADLVAASKATLASDESDVVDEAPGGLAAARALGSDLRSIITYDQRMHSVGCELGFVVDAPGVG